MTSILRRALGRRGSDGAPDGGAAGSDRLEEVVAGRTRLEAIEALTEANRSERDSEIERRLVRLRHEAFAELDRATPSSPAPEMMAEVAEPTDGTWTLVDGLPEVAAADLTARTARAALLGYGSLVVRGLVAPERAAELASGIDTAFDARDRYVSGAGAADTAPWFDPYEPGPDYPKFSLATHNANRIKRGGGAVWAPDSPRMLFDLIETFAAAGLPELVTDYLGERPVLSLQKSVLRRVSPDTGTGWHQDGAFMGEGIRTLNVWIALSACGRDAPGLDLVPKRLDLVETGTEGTFFHWAVSPRVVDELLEGRPASRPVFEAGDAILFDHMCLHSTAVTPDMTEDRYAAETWCFAPSAYPEGRVPLVL